MERDSNKDIAITLGFMAVGLVAIMAVVLFIVSGPLWLLLLVIFAVSGIIKSKNKDQANKDVK